MTRSDAAPSRNVRTLLHAVALTFAMAFLTSCQSTDEPKAAITSGTVKSEDGLSIAYDTGGAGDQSLVFVHGWCCDRKHWRQAMRDFAGDYRVTAIDLGGHGESGTDRDNWTIEGLGGDVEAVVRELDLRNVILVGHSLGGTVSLIAARRLPDRVIGVVGVDCLHDVSAPFRKEEIEGAIAGFRGDFAKSMEISVTTMMDDGVDPGVREWVIERAKRSNQDAVLAIFGDAPNLTLSELMRDAGVPVRCINAAARPPVGPSTDTRGNQRFGDYDVLILEHVGHYPMLEAPDRFEAALEVILREWKKKPEPEAP